MKQAYQDKVIDNIKQSTVDLGPFPHLLIRPFFPDDFYHEILKNMPRLHNYTKHSPGYDKRLMLSFHRSDEVQQLDEDIRGFWKDFTPFLLSNRLLYAFIEKFADGVKERFREKAPKFFPTVDLVLDSRNYALGPHTDHADKVISILFYLPADANYAHIGTKIYVPNNPAFRDFQGRHLDFKDFKRVKAVDYLPNTGFAFLKRDDSFHGVELVTENVERRLIMYNIRVPKEALPADQLELVHGPL